MLVMPPSEAVMSVIPVANVDASPVFEIVATEVVPEAHITCVLISAVEPSVYVPIAENCSVRPLATDGSTEPRRSR